MTLKVVFRDVQHGHSAIILTPNGRCIVIDLGIGDHTAGDPHFSPLLYLRDQLGFGSIDFLIITHPHKDHIDDIENLAQIPAKTLLRPSHLDLDLAFRNVRDIDRRKFDAYRELNDRYTHPVGEKNRLRVPSNWGGVEFHAFTPSACPQENINNHSIVTVLSYHGMKIVIPGDNEPPSFDELFLKDGFEDAIRDSDILLAPHHGRESGFHERFVETVNPRLTIVSDGRFCETTARARYRQYSRGWTVHSKEDQSSDQRRCLTTSYDGHIEVSLSSDREGGRYLSVYRE